jgi:N-acetylglucosamine-6-phosphate deacetylase
MGGVEIAGAAGAARTSDGRLAGSMLTVDVALRNWEAMTQALLAQAIAAASEVPSAAVGLSSGLRAGAPADIVLFDETGTVERVMRRGRWLA